jgi:multiple sugar transport system ATP-binding protein
MPGVTLDGVTKSFGKFTAVRDVSLEIHDGEFVVLVGPSGCGKTTLLRIIAGLEAATTGEIRIGRQNVTRVPPKNRDVAMVFQDYALYPHLNVAQNLGIGLKLRHVRRPEREQRVRQVAAVLGLEKLLARKPSQLSGGQQQRVAIGRAMVREPQVYLMDEPLSNLDAKLRVQMRAELGRLRDRLRVTTVFVTHDQVEAMTLGDRVAVMKEGVIQQVATAQELFDSPANAFVAGFIGSPEMNLVHASVAGGRVMFGPHSLRPPAQSNLRDGQQVIVGIRPTDFARQAATGAEEGTTMSITVEVTELLGAEMRIIFPVDARPAGEGALTERGKGNTGSEETSAESSEVDAIATFTATLPTDVRVKAGDQLDLAVAVDAVHYFDPSTGVAMQHHRPLERQLSRSTRGVEDAA